MMKFYEIMNSKKINTDFFGNLLIKKIIVHYDYPRCFVCQKECQELYFSFMENDINENYVEWCVSQVNLEDINKVNLGLSNVQSLFINKKSYIAKYYFDQNKCFMNEVQAFEGENEIMGNLFMPNFCDMDDDFDFHKLYKTSFDNKEASISIVVEGEDKVKTGVLLKAIKYFKELCSNLSNPVNIDESILTLQRGSTVITFNLENKYKGTFFEDTDLAEPNDEKVNALGNVLNALNPVELLGKNNSEKMIKKYSNFVDSFAKSDIKRPKIVISSPSKSNSVSITFDKESANVKKSIIKKANEIIKGGYKTNSIDFSVVGYLTGILTEKNNKFSFKSLDGKNYEGTVDFNMMGNERSYNVNGDVYKAKITKIITLLNNQVIKEDYKLLDLSANINTLF